MVPYQPSILMSDNFFSSPLLQQLLIAIDHGAAPRELAKCVADYWHADACGIWDGQQLIWYSLAADIAPPLAPNAELPTESSGYHQIQSTFTNGYVIAWHSEPWPSYVTLDDGIGLALSIGLQQYAHQQETLTAQQTLRQMQTIADERTAQLQSSQGLLAKLQAAGRRRVEQLDEANRLKDEFISTISHELRTPLTSMSLAIKMLRQPGINPERQTRYLDILQQQCKQEIDLINDLLALQQLESHQLNTDRQLIDLENILQPLIERFTNTWAKKNLQLQVILPKQTQWQTDPESLIRILQELLTNAGKYAQPDTVVEFTAKKSGSHLTLRVINHGKLIEAADLPYIFQKFRRGKGVTQQAIAGTGLGLALVKSLVQHLQGDISVTSTGHDPLAKTCFKVSLPLEESL
jgi:signal transduction histidine kinase